MKTFLIIANRLKTMLSMCVLCTIMFTTVLLKAQGVVISENEADEPDPAAILDIKSTDQGVLIPRMNKNQRDALLKTIGLLIYQTDNNPGFYFYNGSVWEALKTDQTGGITEETDPQVGNILNNRIPKWDGNKLISSSIEEVNINNTPTYLSTSRIRITDNIKIYQEGANKINSEPKIILEIASNNQAYMFLKGTGDNANVRIGNAYNDLDKGAVYVFDNENSAAEPKAGIEVNAAGQGVIFGDVKNFVEPHPLHENKEIYYATLEGPEAAMYIRGNAELKNGKATIQLPEHYRVLADESSMTVQVTPYSKSTTGLAVTYMSLENGIIVEELMDGKGSYKFAWEITCVRKGYEDYKVVRDKLEIKSNTRALSGVNTSTSIKASSLLKTPTAPESTKSERTEKKPE